MEPSLSQPPRHVDARKPLVGQLDVGISLVVPQQDIEARLVLLDEVVLKRQRFLLVIDQDVIDIARFADQRAGLGVGQPVLIEVAANAGPQDLRFADVDDLCRRRLCTDTLRAQEGAARPFPGADSGTIYLIKLCHVGGSDWHFAR